jgi:enoyl-CoA hydratase/carnithine racemase
MTRLSDYQNRYKTLRFTRSESGVLELAMHTDGGEVQWSVTREGHHAELGRAFADIAADLENKVVILTGTGDSFIARRAMGENPGDASLSEMWERMQLETIAMIENMMSIPVPVICAVNGPALIHSEISVMGQIVLAAEHAEFADTTHVPQKLVPGDGTQLIWPVLLGQNRGSYFLLTGQRLSAQEALALGVVNEVLAQDALLPRARELAEKLAESPHKVLRHTKTVLVRSLHKRLRDELDLGLAMQGLGLL